MLGELSNFVLRLGRVNTMALSERTANLRRSSRSSDSSVSSQYFSYGKIEEFEELLSKRKRKQAGTEKPSVASKLKQCVTRQETANFAAVKNETFKVENLKEETKEDHVVKPEASEDLVHTVKSKSKSEAVSINWEPTYWRAQLANIEKMRQNRDAPVDTMGCEKCPDEKAEPKVLVNSSITDNFGE